MRVLLLAVAAVLFAAPLANAEPVNYRLDPRHTQVGFSVDRFGFNHVLGRFDVTSGEMVLDEAAPQNSSVHAVVQMSSYNSGDSHPFAADCPTTPPPQGTPPRPECAGGRDQHLQAQRWLNVAQFPTMEFRSTSVRLVDATHAQVTGDLTLLGQTHPLTLDVTLNKIGGLPNNPQARAAGFTATGVVKRSTWGLTIASGLIGDDVNITLEALAVPATPAPAAH